MIFYFTGTGNTYAAAMELELRLKERLYNIADCVKKEAYRYGPEEGEAVGQAAGGGREGKEGRRGGGRLGWAQRENEEKI